MERLTKYITPVGKCMTTLNSMKHYMPCAPCRHKAEIKTDSNGNLYTEKFSYCDTCEVKMLFNRLKEYEDLEEQGLLLRLPCKVGDVLWCIDNKKVESFVVKEFKVCAYKINRIEIYFENASGFGLCLFDGTLDEGWYRTKKEAEQALEKMKEV